MTGTFEPTARWCEAARWDGHHADDIIELCDRHGWHADVIQGCLYIGHTYLPVGHWVTADLGEIQTHGPADFHARYQEAARYEG